MGLVHHKTTSEENIIIIEPTVLLSVANSVILKRLVISLFSAKWRSVSFSATMTLQCLSGRSVLKGLNQKSRADTRAGSRKEHIYEITRFFLWGYVKNLVYAIYTRDLNRR